MKLVRLKINSEFRGIRKGFEISFLILNQGRIPLSLILIVSLVEIGVVNQIF